MSLFLYLIANYLKDASGKLNTFETLKYTQSAQPCIETEREMAEQRREQELCGETGRN